MSHLIRKMVALLVLGALLASQALAAPRIMGHSECPMMAAMSHSPATVSAAANAPMADMPEMLMHQQPNEMLADCMDQHEDGCSADHCVSASAGLIRQLDFAIPSASQAVAEVPANLIPAPVSSPYYPPIIL